MFGGKVSTSAEPDFHQPVLRYRFEALENEQRVASVWVKMTRPDPELPVVCLHRLQSRSGG